MLITYLHNLLGLEQNSSVNDGSLILLLLVFIAWLLSQGMFPFKKNKTISKKDLKKNTEVHRPEDALEEFI